MSLRRSPMPPRTQPLARTTGLTRSAPLERTSALARRTPIKPVSTKQAAKNRVRRAMIQALYPERPLCRVPWCLQWADDVHEPLTRARGGSITDPDNQVPLCRPHHREIHDTEPGWAYERGLLRHSGSGDASVDAGAWIERVERVYPHTSAPAGAASEEQSDQGEAVKLFGRSKDDDQDQAPEDGETPAAELEERSIFRSLDEPRDT